MPFCFAFPSPLCRYSRTRNSSDQVLVPLCYTCTMIYSAGSQVILLFFHWCKKRNKKTRNSLILIRHVLYVWSFHLPACFFFSRLEICNDFYRPRVFYGEVRVMLKEKKAEKGDSLRIEKKKGVDISWKQCLQIQWFSMMDIYICTRTLPQDHEIEVLWVNLTPANRKDIEQ